MAYTYNDALSANRDKVRFRIGDTVVSKGPRPDNRNFSNDEIAFALSEEDSRVNGAIAHLFEILASEWTSFALSEREGDLTMDAKEVAANFRTQAEIWRKKPGGADTVERGASIVTFVRDDAYATAAANEYS